MRLRVGHIQFLNCFPLYYGLMKKGLPAEIALFRGTPADLNCLLIDGKLDVSAISSIEYARNFQELLLLPDISISADGEVKSVLLISRFPIPELEGKKVFLTSTSATSQILLKILLRRKYGVECSFIVAPPELRAMLSEGDAALLIGDPALEAYYARDEGFFIYDLAKEWKEFTGLPMVFAVWAVRREIAEQARDLIWKLSGTFSDSLDYSLRNLRQVAASAAGAGFLSRERVEEYFRVLRFELGPAYLEGLKRYYALAYEEGFVQQMPVIKFLPVLPGQASPAAAGGRVSFAEARVIK